MRENEQTDLYQRADNGNRRFLERFERAAERISKLGYSAVNPAAVNSALPKDTTYEEYMKMAITMLDMCSVIYMLEGWERSCGANREYGYALAKGIEILFEHGKACRAEEEKK